MVHGVTLSTCMESAYVRSHAGCETLTGDGLIKYIQNDTKGYGTQRLVEKKTGLKLKMKLKIKVNQS